MKTCSAADSGAGCPGSHQGARRDILSGERRARKSDPASVWGGVGRVGGPAGTEHTAKTFFKGEVLRLHRLLAKCFSQSLRTNWNSSTRIQTLIATTAIVVWTRTTFRGGWPGDPISEYRRPELASVQRSTEPSEATAGCSVYSRAARSGKLLRASRSSADFVHLLPPSVCTCCGGCLIVWPVPCAG